MKSPKILLIGIGGVYNYGCEAIVRGTAAIIHQAYPDAEVIYASPRVIDDRRRLEGSKVIVVERKLPRRFSVKNIFRKLLSIVGIKWEPMLDSLGILKGVDAVFSIGGDIYTLRPNGSYSMALPKFCDAAKKRGVPCALWGASVGPFTDNPKAEEFFAKHLAGLSLISARESATVDYLRSLGICNKVVSCADPAYVVAPEIKAGEIRQGSKFTIGINLSPLSVRHSGYAENEIIQAQAKTIEGLIKAFDARIVLIPHVFSDFNESDDDFRYLFKVKNAIAAELKDSVDLVEVDLGFVGIKKVLINCNLVIAARMHCAINALASHVPTILISYSRKSIGMCEYVYGNVDWVLPLECFLKEGEVETKALSLKSQADKINKYLSRRIPEIQHEAYSPLKKIFKAVE